jgi:hypothetical protein
MSTNPDRAPALHLPREFRGGDIIPKAGTVIAQDGAREIRTPHDDCILIMPTPVAPRGHTAVRLARFEAP